MRWTCGRASCLLQVAPGASGRLGLTVQLPADAGPERAVVVECNGKSSRHEVTEDGWINLTVPCHVGDDGLLKVTLRSSLWVPHRRRKNGDCRTLGCGVEAIEFRSDIPGPPRPGTRVSVIVPTFNRWPILQRTLAALRAQTYSDFELIVVDDGSTDGTWEQLQTWRTAVGDSMNIVLLRQPNLKPGAARNSGLTRATGDLVLFLGDDIAPDRGLVAEHVAKHRQLGEPVAVLGYTDWDRQGMRVTPFLDFVNRDGQQFAYGHLRDGDDVPFTCLYTSNVSVPRWVLGCSPFHPAFTFVDWEDVELGYRLSLRGLRIIYHRRASARHLHPMRMRDFYLRQQHVGRTLDVLLALHPELRSSESMPPIDGWQCSRWLRFVVPALMPVLDRADYAGIRLPDRLLRDVALAGYLSGRRRGWSGPLPGAMSGAPALATSRP